MGRKFVDFIGGRDYLLNAAADQGRVLAVLPNGMPYWQGLTANQPGSELPAGFDFVTHAWTFEFMFRSSSHSSTVVAACATYGQPFTAAQQVWELLLNANGTMTFTQRTTASGTYRATTSTGMSTGSNWAFHLVCPAGGTPAMYVNNIDPSAQTAPSGTPRPAAGEHRMYLRGGDNSGLAVPALYPFAMDSAMRADHIATLNAA